jgi:hypothetical protein
VITETYWGLQKLQNNTNKQSALACSTTSKHKPEEEGIRAFSSFFFSLNLLNHEAMDVSVSKVTVNTNKHNSLSHKVDDGTIAQTHHQHSHCYLLGSVKQANIVERLANNLTRSVEVQELACSRMKLLIFLFDQ